MLRSRITPCLLVKDGALYKTVNFKEPKYIGDPLNTVRIFNEKEVDEIIILDIDASVLKNEPNYKLIKDLALECRMPLCYGGGINSDDQIERIVGYGVEKVSINSGAIKNPSLIETAAKRVGSQSIAVTIDVSFSKKEKRYIIYKQNGLTKTDLDLKDWIIKVQSLGAGEIIINSIDRDGTMQGYDLDLVDFTFNITNTPITLLGGAGSLDDIKDIIEKYKIIGAAAGSLFVFKGKYRAVLVNYPNSDEKNCSPRSCGCASLELL